MDNSKIESTPNDDTKTIIPTTSTENTQATLPTISCERDRKVTISPTADELIAAEALLDLWKEIRIFSPSAVSVNKPSHKIYYLK